jgi:hypothetical protein
VRAWLVAGVVAVGLLASAPSASALGANATCVPSAACTGWSNTNVILRWFPSPDATDSDNCPNPKTISAEGVTPWTCGVTDGVVWNYFTATVRIDRSAPTATGAVTSRGGDANGWFNHAVGIAFVGTDAVSGVASCTALTYAGPDATAAALSGTCTDRAGNASAASSVTLRYDATAPDITAATPGRRPDHDGWYNHPARLDVRAGDALSGLAQCAPVELAAPQVVASCADKAGNVATRTFAFRYDATPPAVRVSTEPADGRAYVRWDAEGAERIKVVRAPGEHGAKRSVVYRGHGRGLSDGGLRNGRRYRYEVTATDQADNAATRTVHVVPGARLLSPRSGARLAGPPLLRWTRVRHTRYYNLQLYRVVGGRQIKLLTTWPRRPRFALERTWRYGGRRRALVPGLYRWFVWPGEGAPAERRFGALVGRGSFRITGAPGPAPPRTR